MIRKTTGFTLMELMVAITVSGIILSAVMTSYAALVANKQKIDQFRHTQSAATLSMSKIADKVRDFGINYDAYEGGDASTETTLLHIGPYIDENEVEHDISFEIKNGKILMQYNDRVAPITGGLVVSDGAFVVQPSTVPNRGEGAQLYQPRVDVDLSFVSADDESIKMDLETSLSSRQYR